MDDVANSPSSPPPEPRFLAKQLAMGFGAVSLVAVGMCGMLLASIYEVSSQISDMRRTEATVRAGRELSTAVREVSLHIAHTVIEGDRSHLDHYMEWRDRVRTRIQQLSPAIPREQRPHLLSLAERTQRLHELLLGEALPAAKDADLTEVRRIHRTMDALGQQAADDADALARAAARQMVHAHVDATAMTRTALMGGGLCIALVLALSVGFTLRLRAAVLKPLGALTSAARRFGRGEFDTRVGEVGRGELRALARAFDRMADELAQREARLVQQERMAAIGQLAAGIAHELNNPIAIIRGYLDTMDPDGDRQVLRDELSILDEEAGHCQRIADDLLAYARSDDLRPEPTAMALFIERTATRFRETAPGQAHPLELDLQPCEIECDANRMRQVLLNLLGNAAHVSATGAPIRVSGWPADNGYLIAVDDDGPGVPLEERTRIFEPFYGKRPGGSGLGLSVCLGIVEAHGGTIRAGEGLNGGARFVVYLPRHHSPSLAPSASAQTNDEEESA